MGRCSAVFVALVAIKCTPLNRIGRSRSLGCVRCVYGCCCCCCRRCSHKTIDMCIGRMKWTLARCLCIVQMCIQFAIMDSAMMMTTMMNMEQRAYCVSVYASNGIREWRTLLTVFSSSSVFFCLPLALNPSHSLSTHSSCCWLIRSWIVYSVYLNLFFPSK